MGNGIICRKKKKAALGETRLSGGEGVWRQPDTPGQSVFVVTTSRVGVGRPGSNAGNRQSNGISKNRNAQKGDQTSVGYVFFFWPKAKVNIAWGNAPENERDFLLAEGQPLWLFSRRGISTEASGDRQAVQKPTLFRQRSPPPDDPSLSETHEPLLCPALTSHRPSYIVNARRMPQSKKLRGVCRNSQSDRHLGYRHGQPSA